jgi:hypothetical protein
MPSIPPEILHEIVTRHSSVNWILAGVNYLYELQMATSLMLRYSNVCLETSCAMGYAAIEKTVQLCGSEQLLFGSGLRCSSPPQAWRRLCTQTFQPQQEMPYFFRISASVRGA